jgi:hypothetical protein
MAAATTATAALMAAATAIKATPTIRSITANITTGRLLFGSDLAW